MYQAHFQLDQLPFSIAPDPNFLYLSSSHREALAHLMYGFSHGGFVLITGEVGTGKTTLLRNLVKQTPADLDVAFILNPRLTVRELLETICDELAVQYDRASTTTVKQYIDALNRHLLKTHAAGRSTVVIIDEAQNLSPAVLEQIRLLTNLETDERKLLRIILLGQPELAELLDRQELRQLAQRITARYHLGSLDRQDTYAYVIHRLSRAGGNPQIFTNGALRRLYSLSRGIPRIVNVLADRALLGAYVEGKNRVSARIVTRASREVLSRPTNVRKWVAAGVATIGITGVAWAYLAPDTLPIFGPDFGPKIGALLTPEGPSTQIEASMQIEDPLPSPAPPEDQSGGDPQVNVDIKVNVDDKANVDSPPAEVLEAITIEPEDTLIEPQDILIEPDMQTSSIDVPSIDPADTLPNLLTGKIARPPGNSYASRRQAYDAVFDRWGVQFIDTSVEQIPCNFAPSAGLQCLSLRGGWSEVKRLNLPVVIELWDDEPSPYYAALTHQEGSQITVQLAGQELQLSQRDLREIWYGAFVVLWQTPPGYHGSLREGDRHETVAWLRRQLAALSPEAPTSGNDIYFDNTLRDRVIDFQSEEGLLTDGVVGPATWIRLADRLQLPAPDLAG